MDPTKPIKPTQAQVKRSIVDWCNHNGGFATVINVAGIPIKGNIKLLRKNTDMAGMGDVLICWRSKYIEVELKRPKQKLDPAQEDRKFSVERAGGRFWTVDGFSDFLNKMIDSNEVRE
jgi:hypothetical protein|tara:strand:+ start:283 stop:636 length:354 start_codon:yes stop_codon:yes gene_type:complete